MLRNVKVSKLACALVAGALVALPMGVRLWLKGGEQVEAAKVRQESYLAEETSKAARDLDQWYATTRAVVKRGAAIPGLASMGPEEALGQTKNAISGLPWASVGLFTRADGQIVLRSDGEPAVNIADRAYHKAAMESGFGRQVVVSRTVGRPRFLLAQRLIDAKEGDGVFSLGADLDKISESLVRSEREGERRFVALEDGKLLAHSEAEEVKAEALKKGVLSNVSSHPMWSARPSAGLVKIARYKDKTGVEMIGALRQSELGWFVAVELPRQEGAEAARDPASITMLALAALAAAALGACAAALHGRMGSGGTRKVAGLMALAVALPLAGLGAAERSRDVAEAKQEAKLTLKRAVASDAAGLDGWMRGNLAALEPLAGAPGLVNAARAALGGDAESRTKVISTMRRSLINLRLVVYAWVADKEGQIDLRTDEPKSTNVSDRKYFKQARVDALGWQMVLSRVTGLPTLILAKAIKNELGEFQGVAALGAQPSAFLRELVGEQMGEAGERFVLDAEGNLAAHSDKSVKTFNGEVPVSYIEHPLWRERSAKDKKPSVAEFEQGGRRFIGSIARAGIFHVAAALSMEEVEAKANEALLSFAALALAAVLAAGVAGAALGSMGRAGRGT